MAGRILIVDDEAGIRFSLRGILEDEGHEVLEADSGEAALKSLEQAAPDLAFLDIWLPGMDGIAVLERLKEARPDLPAIMISGHGSIETAVAAIKKGAFDFIEKPLSLEKVVLATNKALELSQLKRENLALRESLSQDHPVRLTGSSPAIQALSETIAQVAPTTAWVLITGENGTGKEIVARSIHVQSKRAHRPLVAVNCAAIPEELFGLDQLLGDGRAVDLDEGAGAPAAEGVNRARDQLLAGAVLPENEDAPVGRRRHRDLFAQLVHRVALADHRQVLIDAGAQGPVLLLEVPLAQRVADGEHRLLERQRLLDEVVRAGPDGLDGRLDVAVPGDHDHRRVDLAVAETLEGREPVDSGQPDVEEDEVVDRARGPIQTALSAVDGVDQVALVA